MVRDVFPDHYFFQLLHLVGVLRRQVVLLARILVQVIEFVVVGGGLDADADEFPGADAGGLAVALGILLAFKK